MEEGQGILSRLSWPVSSDVRLKEMENDTDWTSAFGSEESCGWGSSALSLLGVEGQVWPTRLMDVICTDTPDKTCLHASTIPKASSPGATLMVKQKSKRRNILLGVPGTSPKASGEFDDTVASGWASPFSSQVSLLEGEEVSQQTTLSVEANLEEHWRMPLSHSTNWLARGAAHFEALSRKALTGLPESVPPALAATGPLWWPPATPQRVQKQTPTLPWPSGSGGQWACCCCAPQPGACFLPKPSGR